MTAVQEALVAEVPRPAVRKQRAKTPAAAAREAAAAAAAADAAVPDQPAAAGPEAEITEPVRMSPNGNNIATVAGWLAEYDYWTRKFKLAHGWCDRVYAYQNASVRTHNYGNVIPYDGSSDREETAVRIVVPWEYLNAEGRKFRLEQDARLIEEFTESMMRAVEYGCAGENYLRITEANEALAAFGLPPVEYETSYDGYISGSIYFSTSARIQLGQDVFEQAVIRAVGEALSAAAGKDTGFRAKGKSYGTAISRDLSSRPVMRIKKKTPEELAAVAAAVTAATAATAAAAS
jgi:hypothetical protein